MPNSILRTILNKDRGLLGELQLDMYEIKLLEVPFNLRNWSRFTKLRELFK